MSGGRRGVGLPLERRGMSRRGRPTLRVPARKLFGDVARSYNRAMASWRCPQCGTAQTETAVCWVCQRSTISCSSCLHFRRSVVGRLGYCALDRSRKALSGDEERVCWVRGTAEAARAPEPAGPSATQPPSLWVHDEPQPDPSDRSVRSSGMWAESDTHPAAIPPAVPHAGSVRPRPWGPPPGLVNVPRGFRETPKPR
jgi:hypothetical protein